MEEDILKKEWEECCERCNKCRSERTLSEYEKDDLGHFCPPHPGCGDYKENVDVFFLTMGHAGEKIFPKKDFDKLKEIKEKHYISNDPYDNFHSFLIRRLINKIKEKNETRTWYLTDIWKCFIRDRLDKKLEMNQVKKENIRNNVEISFDFCKGYLIKEIEILKPKVIVLFGGKVKDFYENKIKESLNHKPNCIYSMFPGTRTADAWFGKYKNNSNY